jgi:hypothetical protein
MTQRLSFSLSALLCLSACKAATARPSVLVDPDILPDVTSRESSWVAARTPLALSGGPVSSCESYATLHSSGVVEDVANQLVKSEYLICDVLGRVGKDSELGPLVPAASYAEALASRLDLRSFPSSLGPRLEDDRFTLERLFGAEALQRGPRGVAVSTTDLSYVLKAVVVGDLDQSGADDWLVWLTDEVLAGNYRSYQTLLIKDVGSQGLLLAQPL